MQKLTISRETTKPQNIYIEQGITNPKFIQQHKASNTDAHNKVTFTYYSNRKHELTDMYTVAIWTIKYKNKKS